MSEIVESWGEYKGSRFNATYNEETQMWDLDIPAGAESSYGQSNHTYPITLHAKDAAGNETVMQATDPTYGDQLNFRVLEKTKPTATIVSPTDNLLTNSNKVTVAGTAAAGSDAVTLASVKINGETVSVGDGGAFSKEIALQEGENTITVVAEDSIGKTTSVTRHVTVDTKAPVISDVEAEATTVDANSTIHITFRVTDPAD